MPAPTGRRETYMQRYARALNAAYRVQAITKAVQDEQDRVQYTDSLIATERQILEAAMQRFSVEEPDFEASRKLLEQVSALDAEAARLRGVSGARVRESVSLPSELKDIRDPNQFVVDASRLALDSGGMTPQRKQAILAQATRLGVKDTSTLAARLKAIPDRKAAGLSAAETEAFAQAQTAAQKAQEAAFFAGPSGIRGGFEGMAEVDLRKMTPEMLRAEKLDDRAKALEDSAFGTEEDALNAALAIVQATGDPAQIDDPLARDVYERARAMKAYRNDQRADFEQEVLNSRKRLVQLEAERERIAGAYDDPRQEILRRELRARGFQVEDPYNRNPETGEWEANPSAWKNAYIKFQNTPEHAYYIGAHQKVLDTEGEVLSPSSRSENIAVSYTMMRDRQGMQTTPQELAAQLRKAGIKGRELEAAVSFTMAWWEKGGPDQDPEQAKLDAKDEARKKQEEAARRKAATDAKRIADEQRQVTAQMEREQNTAVTDLRAEQALAQRKQSQRMYVEEYKRQVAMGKTREEAVQAARQKAIGVGIITGEARPDTGAAKDILMQPEFMLEQRERTSPEALRARRTATLESLQSAEGASLYTPEQIQAMAAVPGATEAAVEAARTAPGTMTDPETGRTAMVFEDEPPETSEERQKRLEAELGIPER